MGLISYILRAISEFKTHDRREEGYYVIHKEKDDPWPTNVLGTDMSIDLGFTTSDRKCMHALLLLYSYSHKSTSLCSFVRRGVYYKT